MIPSSACQPWPPDQPDQSRHAVALRSYTTSRDTTTSRSLDPKELIVAGNLIWSPVSGLDIGVEVLYTRTELKQAVLAANNAGARPALAAGGRLVKSDDAFAGRLRIQRDF